MHHLLLLLSFIIGDSVLLVHVSNSIDRMDAGLFPLFYIVSVVVILGWVAIFVNKVKEQAEDQIKDLQKLELAGKYKDSACADMERDMESIATALNNYKDELKPILVDKYETFEKALMESVRNSKIIATILEKSGYAEILNKYDKNVAGYINEIKTRALKASQYEKECLDQMLDAHRDLIKRKSYGIFGYHWFFPKRIRYTETEAPSAT